MGILDDEIERISKEKGITKQVIENSLIHHLNHVHGDKEVSEDEVKELFKEVGQKVYFTLYSKDNHSMILNTANVDWNKIFGLDAYERTIFKNVMDKLISEGHINEFRTSDKKELHLSLSLEGVKFTRKLKNLPC